MKKTLFVFALIVYVMSILILCIAALVFPIKYCEGDVPGWAAVAIYPVFFLHLITQNRLLAFFTKNLFNLTSHP